MVGMYANFVDNGNQKKENTIKPILIVSSGLHLKSYQEINIFVRLFPLGNIVTTRRTSKQYKLGVRYYFILVTISLESLLKYYSGTQNDVLITEVSTFQRFVIERFHCMYMYSTNKRVVYRTLYVRIPDRCTFIGIRSEYGRDERKVQDAVRGFPVHRL